MWPKGLHVFYFRYYAWMKKCLNDVKLTCDQNQRVAIGNNVISVLEGIVGSDWCGLDLWDFICEWTQVDPTTVCDVVKARACAQEKNKVADNIFASKCE